MEAKTVRVIVAGGVLVAVVGGIYGWSRRGDAPRAEEASASTLPAADAAPAVVAKPPPPAEPREPRKVPDLRVPLRPLDKQILARVPKGLTKGKVADAFPKAAWQIELIPDAQDPKRIGRIDVDTDRDGRPEERWQLGENGAMRRHVRTQDPVTREDVYTLSSPAAEWQLVSGTGESATPQPPPERVPFRPIDTQVFALAKKGSPVDLPDASPGKPYKIALFHQGEDPNLTRAKIDLDRDGKWDEVWFVDPVLARREVSPNDDERFTDIYRLRDGKWEKKSALK